MKKLNGKKIAIVATDGFEHSELVIPKKELEKAGASVDIISIKAGEIKSWKDKNWGDSVKVNFTLGEAASEDYDALMLPGGVMNPDTLRIDEDAISFIHEFTESGKPIAAICHGLWPLIETNILEGRNVTSWPSLRSDLTNAGAHWSDQEVVVDQGLVTSRKPEDIPAFCEKFIEEIAEGVHDEVTAGEKFKETEHRSSMY